MTDYLQLAQTVADRFTQLPEVEAIAIGGSRAAGNGSDTSDIDLYVYPSSDIPAEVRLSIGREFADNPQVGDVFGPGVEWDDSSTGLHVDVILFSAGWMQDQIERVLVRHEASLGYTTALWHSVRISKVLFDRNGWFANLQQVASQPYPDQLIHAIVKLNFPLLLGSFSNYTDQIHKAAQRGDLVSLNHRTAALLASYFDILFAINRVPHPGEKRLLDLAERHCPKRPADMRQHITQMLTAAGTGSADVVQHTDAVVDGIEQLLREEGYL
jgi:hypothetical protein